MNKPGQPDPRDQQDHGQESPDHRLGGEGIVQPAEQKDPDAPERFPEISKARVGPPLSQVEPQRADQPGQDHAPDDPADLVSVPTRSASPGEPDASFSVWW